MHITFMRTIMLGKWHKQCTIVDNVNYLIKMTIIASCKRSNYHLKYL